MCLFCRLKKKKLEKRLKKRPNYNKLLKKFKKIQFTPVYKKRKAQFIIKNKFTKKSVSIGVKNILKKILK